MKKILKVFAWIFGVLAGLYVILLVVNSAFALALNNYIKSFKAVEYGDGERLTPVLEQYDSEKETKYWTFKTDDDLTIMEINDIHIGGGFWSYKNDKKTVYEVMNMVYKQAEIEKPDLIILVGDSIFAVPGPIFNGGGTLNNKMASKQIITMFDTLGVYYTITFGNHDTEAFDYYSRQQIGELYHESGLKNGGYCIFQSDFNEVGTRDKYSYTNQCILVKNAAGTSITQALMIIDSNDYQTNSIMDSINWKYDTIHQEQIDWAEEVIQDLSRVQGSTVKCLAFFHIPIGEFETAYSEIANSNLELDIEKTVGDTTYVEGYWGEKISEDIDGRVWYGGCCQTDKDPNDVDLFFETLGPDGLNSLQAIFVGHDHVNNNVVIYKGVMLSYGNSIDNIAYTDINKYGKQRGCTIIEVKSDGTFTQDHKNMYTDLGVSSDEYVDVDTSKLVYEGELPSLVK